MTQEFYTQITTYGLELISQHTLSGDPFIADGWYIALGTGNIIPTIDTLSLVNKIYDKYISDYPGISIGTDPSVGRYAELQVPFSLQGNVITEVGLFDNQDNLILCANTVVDMTKSFEQGLYKTFKVRLSLNAIPADLSVITVNPPSNYPTITQTTTIVDNGVSEHNLDLAAHSYLARKAELVNYILKSEGLSIPVGLSLSQSSQNITIAPGHCLDSTKTKTLTLGSALTKDFSLPFEKGATKGALIDTALSGNLKIYAYLIANDTEFDLVGAVNDNFTLPAGFTYKAKVGFVETSSTGLITVVSPKVDLATLFLNNNLIRNWEDILPVYASAINKSWSVTWTADVNGQLCGWTRQDSGGAASISINGKQVYQSWSSGDVATYNDFSYLIRKGDVITSGAGGNVSVAVMIFSPAKGEI